MTPRRLLINTGVSTFVYLAGSVAGLVLVPILLDSLGATRFGLFVLAQTTLSYSSLLGGGLNRGFIRSIAARQATRDARGVKAVIGTGFCMISAFAALVTISIVVFRPALSKLYAVPPVAMEEFTWILYAATAAYVFAVLVTPHQALLVASGRLDTTKWIELWFILAGTIASAVVVRSGYGLRGVAVSIAVTSLLKSAITLGVARKSNREAVSIPRRIDLQVARELWAYGYRAQTAALAGMVNKSIDRITLGVFVHAEAVARYDVGDRAAFSLVYTANTLSQALAPDMAAHVADGNVHAAQGLYRSATLYFSLSAGILTAYAVSQSKLLLSAWLGRFDQTSALALVILGVGYGVAVSLSASQVVASSEATPSLLMRFSLAQTVVNVILSGLGAVLWGIPGAALGSALSGGLGSLTLAFLAERRILNLPGTIGVRTVFRCLPIVAGPALLIGYLSRALVLLLDADRLASFGILAVALLAQALLTFLAGSLAGVVPRDALKVVLRSLFQRGAGGH
ncbi:MAG: lipopolysaccharide biosynthesis protein [Coriobacteriia bacterium]